MPKENNSVMSPTLIQSLLILKHGSKIIQICETFLILFIKKEANKQDILLTYSVSKPYYISIFCYLPFFVLNFLLLLLLLFSSSVTCCFYYYFFSFLFLDTQTMRAF